ncbi:uncharacterized protein LOC129567549 isoform X2 [Sitodiplosis mosellana]|uniref:uncharacterized protein LOC129567549 isoform X2 n=1 Tax=Sitodiplosis mosellana TaxID=263140 RepID=UPI002445286C|nr:uncharacterized protein LOC129567549 isoform X2 [Sitodiplosis mosellana]
MKNLAAFERYCEALHAWRTKARCNIVPAERLHELFEELDFNPTEKQITEMLQTAKLFARRGNGGLERGMPLSSRHTNGLTFGEFCALAADLKRFRTQYPLTTSSRKDSAYTSFHESQAPTKNGSKDELKPTDCNSAPEVFLGGSCNPTTWRADVAIPTLEKLGISFYNPQVSDWTPDLIELEHRAKEKARVLFFVMDSETRASAAAIEVAYISGHNPRHLVLVLNPYKPEQCILNEPISPQEYIDLKRNQQLLREIVSRRGLPVLDDVPSGLQQTKAILTGTCFSAPQNVASKLITIRRAFDRALGDQSENPTVERITLEQCRCALNFLGCSQNLLQIENLSDIVKSHRDMSNSNNRNTASNSEITIDFEEFCVLTSYLTILQDEISESGCVSPIKGTNLPPPPIFLTNTPEWLHTHSGIVRHVLEERTTKATDTHRDSGTSSPINPDSNSESGHSSRSLKIITRNENQLTSFSINLNNAAPAKGISFDRQTTHSDETEEELSDSNDSVFSSGSSIDSILNYNGQEFDETESLDLRDIYLGGSCALRSNWRNEVIAMLNEHDITYHMPQLHESLIHSQHSDLDGRLSTSPPVQNEPSSSKPLETSSSNDSGISTGQPRNSYRTANGTVIYPSGKRMFHLSLLESSRVLLFVISNETRSLAPMTLAAHCVGMGYNVVLCVQMLSNDCCIGDDKLTCAAVKDYNRGRSYLIDLARRQDVPVFNDLKQAAECAIEKVKQCNSRSAT